MEHIVNNRLNDKNVKDHPQHVFCKGFGTGAYFASVFVLDDALQASQHGDIASWNVSKAFNRTWTPFVLKQLFEWGLPGYILHFVQNFLRNKTFLVCIGNHKSNTVTLSRDAMNGILEILFKYIYTFLFMQTPQSSLLSGIDQFLSGESSKQQSIP